MVESLKPAVALPCSSVTADTLPPGEAGARYRGGPRLLHIYWGKKCIRDWAEPGCTPWGGCQPTDVVGGSMWQVIKCRGRRRPLTWWTWPRTYGPCNQWVETNYPLGQAIRPVSGPLASRAGCAAPCRPVLFKCAVYSTAGCPRGPACCAACSGTGRV